MELSEIQKRMHEGKIYPCNDPRLIAIQAKTQDQLFEYNHTPHSEGEKRTALLKEMLASLGENSYIEPPFHANWGGKHVYMGEGVYCNVFLSLVDDGHIYIGDHVMIGPHVTISAATHPISPQMRMKSAEYNLPVHIGNNVWIGAGAVILPGVTIGDNSVIGAGSVVTHDIPGNVVAVGTPARVLRQITEEDYKTYNGGETIDPSEF